MILQRLMRRVLTSPPGRRPGLRAGAAGLVVLSFSAVLLAPPSAADTGDEKRAADAQVADLEEQLSETSAELAQAYTALTQTQAQLPAARARLTSAQSAARAAAKHNEEVAAALAVAQANAARAEEAVARNTATRDQTQRTLDAFAADLFQGGSVGQLSVALGATSADDFATRLVLADTVTAMTNQALNDLAAAKADGDANGAYLAAVQVEVTDLKRQAENALAAAEASRNEAQAASSALDALVAQQSGYAASVEAQRANEASQLAEAQAEQQRLQALLIEQARIAREREAARKAAEAAAQKAAEEAARKNGTAVPPPPQPADHRWSHQLGVRHAFPPDLPGLAVAHRPRFRQRLQFARVCRRARHDHQGRVGRWARQPDRHRPRDPPGCRPGHDLQPPHVLRPAQRHRVARSAHWLYGDDRELHRLPPALRDVGRRPVRQSALLVVGVLKAFPAAGADGVALALR